jgi:uncharacterized membrane protein YkvA (DUF1232 family)
MNVFWLYLAVIIVVGLVVASLLLFSLVRWLTRREPYGTFMRLRTRRKLTFFRLMLGDTRIPFYVKAIPIGLVAYLSIPFDIIPDFVPVLGYLDDVAIALLALVLIIKLSPRQVVTELLQKAEEADVSS